MRTLIGIAIFANATACSAGTINLPCARFYCPKPPVVECPKGQVLRDGKCWRRIY